MCSCCDHFRQQNRRIGFIGCHCGDDVGTFDGGGCRFGTYDTQIWVGAQIIDELVGRRWIDVKHANFFNAQNAVESDRLEFTLCTIAD